YLLAIATLALVETATAQNATQANATQTNATQANASHWVGGLVTDEYGKPLAGVRVYTKGQDNDTFTDKEGHYRLEAAFGKKLVFSHPQFDELQHEAKTDTLKPIRLTARFLHTAAVGTPTSIAKKDTIIIPPPAEEKIDVLYEQADRESFLGSISTVDRQALDATPATNYLNAVQGRLTGLNITQGSGFGTLNLDSLTTRGLFSNIPTNNSGAGISDNTQFNIQLRAHAASFGQNPIAIVDGVQREYYSIDPETIQSISILKDPLSNLLLGQNSSRGAIIVTTNEPTIGPTRLSVTAESGTQTSLGLPQPLPAYQYAYLLNEALLNDGKSPIYSQADFNAYRYHTDPQGHPDVNWYHTILRSAPMLSRVNLNAAGGSALARYVVSLSYMNDQGIFVADPNAAYNTNVGLQRYMLNSKVDVDVNKDFSLRVQVMGRLQDANQPGATFNNILSTLLSTPNNAYPVHNHDKSYGGNANFPQNLMGMVEGSGYTLDHLRDVLSNVVLNYKLDRLTRGLWVRASGDVSVSSETNMNRSFSTEVYSPVVSSPGDTTYSGFGASTAQQNRYNTGTWARYRFVQGMAGYDRRFGEHSVNARLLFDQKRSLVGYDLPAELTNYGAKAAYSYKDRYFLQGAADYSGYDRYAPGHQYGLFYAGGAGWDIAREPAFHKLAPWIDRFKLRATYGRTGNANVDYYGYYIWAEHFGQGAGNYPMGSTYQFQSENIAEGGAPGSQVLANINATWEKADKFDGGIDLAFLQNRVVLTADYYHEKYYDVMQDRGDNLALIGIAYPAENIGRDLYTGLELELTWQDHIGNVNYFITGNAAAQQSKVLFMDEQYEQNPWNVHTGRPVNQMFGYIAQGLFQTAADAAASPSLPGYTQHAGDIKYKDLNGDGSIDQFDLAPITRSSPLVIYGLSAGVSFKGIELSALLQGEANRPLYLDQTYYNFGFLNQGNTYSQAYTPSLGRWIPENGVKATAPRLTAGGNQYNGEAAINTFASSYWVKNGDFFRIKNVCLSYTL
ncbi:MAG TPA: SusC/RagA family TonB-linked outer membrane protein, partial [Puia sp.]|nr:SusC/RagA family TonB-linked outer membrane protein [Puia sp.]